MTLSPSPRPAPLAFTIAFTLFVVVLVVKYWSAYGPLNFLYFCDVALATTLIAMWRTWPLLASMGAVGILLPQTLWMIDFLVRLTTGGHVVDLTEYISWNCSCGFCRSSTSGCRFCCSGWSAAGGMIAERIAISVRWRAWC